jgi:hypothetical protein
MRTLAEYIALLCLLCFPFLAGAQAKNEQYAPYDKVGVVRIFADQVEVREGPEITYRVRGLMVMGTEVSVIEQGTDWLTVENYSDVWYKVRGLGTRGEILVGWVWGGDLADFSVADNLDNDPETEILLIRNRTWNDCGVWEHEKWESGLDIKVVKDGFVWAKSFEKWNYIGNLSFEAVSIALTNTQANGFFLSFDWARCDKGHSRQFYLLRSGTITPQFTLIESLENKEQKCTERALFPDNPIGTPDAIVIHSTCTQKADGSKGYATRTFRWDGRDFQPVR